MVESQRIKDSYNQLLELIKLEASVNRSIGDYYNYLSEYKDKFSEEANLHSTQYLKEFLKGANRYSDEFVFSEKHYSEIREITNTLYDILNTENPI